MAEVKKKRVTLHPLRKDGRMDTSVNLYPKCFLDGIVDRQGQPVQVALESEIQGVTKETVIDLDDYLSVDSRRSLDKLLFGDDYYGGDYDDYLNTNRSPRGSCDLEDRIPGNLLQDNFIKCRFTVPESRNISAGQWFDNYEFFDRDGDLVEYERAESQENEGVFLYEFFPINDDIQQGYNKSEISGYIKLDEDGSWFRINFNLPKGGHGRIYLNAMMDGWNSSDNQQAKYYRSSTDTYRMMLRHTQSNTDIYPNPAFELTPYIDGFGSYSWSSGSKVYSETNYCPGAEFNFNDGLNTIEFHRGQTRSLIIESIILVLDTNEDVLSYEDEIVFNASGKYDDDKANQYTCVYHNECGYTLNILNLYCDYIESIRYFTDINVPYPTEDDNGKTLVGDSEDWRFKYKELQGTIQDLSLIRQYAYDWGLNGHQYVKDKISDYLVDYITYSDYNYGLSQKQDVLVSGSNIKTVNGQSLLGSGDVQVVTYQSFNPSWPTTNQSTTAQFCAAIDNDASAVIGMAYLGGASWSDLPFSGNGDVQVEIMQGPNNTKSIHLTLTSSNREPYHWEYTYWNHGSNSGWIGFQPEINDLSTIRSNAALGATAVQPADLSSVESALEAQIQAVPQGDVTTAQLTTALADKQDIIEDLEDIRTYANNSEQVTIIDMPVEDLGRGVQNYTNNGECFGYLMEVLDGMSGGGDVAADHTIPVEFASMDNEELAKQKVIGMDSNGEYRPLVLSNFYIFDTADPYSNRPQNIKCDIEGMQPRTDGLYSGYFRGIVNYCCDHGSITGSYLDGEYGVCNVDFNEIVEAPSLEDY